MPLDDEPNVSLFVPTEDPPDPASLLGKRVTLVLALAI
jgi:hypothetical protein